jgi:3,4-dihydroxy 2-butanone 4-phosphate synthase/GTP cyclohydrolase II
MNPNQEIEHWLAANKKTFHLNDRPFVTLCYAQSLDGSIAIRSGEPLALSGQESLQLTHQLRSIHDGILVGIGTVLSDDPQLNVRHWTGLDPQPIVLDSKLRIPANARLRQLPDKRCWVLTTIEGESLANDGEDYLIDGLEITALKSNSEGRVCLERALRLLRTKGIKSLMVEGGAGVITAFLKAQLADAIVVTLVPCLVGGYKAVSDLGVRTKYQLPEISPLHSAQLGKDVILWGNLHYGAAVA